MSSDRVSNGPFWGHYWTVSGTLLARNGGLWSSVPPGEGPKRVPSSVVGTLGWSDRGSDLVLEVDITWCNSSET